MTVTTEKEAAAAGGELDFASAAEAAQAVRRGQVGARELTERMLARIARLDPKLGAMAKVLAEGALVEADRLDADRRRGEDPGPLHGLGGFGGRGEVEFAAGRRRFFLCRHGHRASA